MLGGHNALALRDPHIRHNVDVGHLGINQSILSLASISLASIRLANNQTCHILSNARNHCAMRLTSGHACRTVVKIRGVALKCLLTLRATLRLVKGRNPILRMKARVVNKRVGLCAGGVVAARALEDLLTIRIVNLHLYNLIIVIPVLRSSCCKTDRLCLRMNRRQMVEICGLLEEALVAVLTRIIKLLHVTLHVIVHGVLVLLCYRASFVLANKETIGILGILNCHFEITY